MDLHVCPLAYLKKQMSKLCEFILYMLPVAVARYSSDDNEIRYVLPVLWMTSCFHIMGQIQIWSWSMRCSELFTVTRQVAPGAKSAIDDCVVSFDVAR